MTNLNFYPIARLAGLNFSRLTVLGIACLNMSFGAPINSATTVLGGTPLTTFEGFAEGTLMQNQVSSPRESHPEALSEPYLNLSSHTAPAMEPRRTPICQ